MLVKIIHEALGITIEEIVGTHTEPEEFDLTIQRLCIIELARA